MSDYSTVSTELDRGTPPELLCATCPWSRPCVTPPTMTKAQIDAHMNKTLADEQAQAALDPDKPRGLPIASLMTALIYGGKDTSAQICPVFAMRLTGPDGRGIADGLRVQMRDWQQS